MIICNTCTLSALSKTTYLSTVVRLVRVRVQTSVTWSLVMKHVTRTTTNPNVYKYQHLFNKIMVRPCSRTRHYFTTNLFFFGFFPSLFVNTARFWCFHLSVHAKLWFAMSYFRVSGTVTTGIQHCFTLNIATLVLALSGCDDILLVKHCQVLFT